MKKEKITMPVTVDRVLDHLVDRIAYTEALSDILLK
jgi:hypothetical protein